MKMTLTSKQLEFVAAAREGHEPESELTMTRTEVLEVCEKHGINVPQWLTNSPTLRAGRGQYTIPFLPTGSKRASKAVPAPKASKAVEASPVQQATQPPQAEMAFHLGSLVPEKLPTYVPFGCHADIKKIIASRQFFAVYVTGLSGNGKTTTFEQVCAELGREFFRVNITPETSEDDLIGGFRLINGETVWVDGPVVVAMKRGAVLLLDEVDLGTSKIMCLQGVLEGKPYFIKKTCTWVTPKPGFTVGLTGNTKGRGDETGKFIGTNVLNEAFLDRTPLMIEQEYPDPKVEEKIVLNVMKQAGSVDEEFARHLTRWAEQNRRAYREQACDDVITTRRLVHAAQAFSIFGDRLKAVEGILTRFDAATRTSLLDLYKKLDAKSDGGVNSEPLGEAPKVADSNAAPF